MAVICAPEPYALPYALLCLLYMAFAWLWYLDIPFLLRGFNSLGLYWLGLFPIFIPMLLGGSL